MIIKTDRLVIEPLGTKHFETTCGYSMSLENTKYMCYLPCDSTGEVMQYLEKCERQWKMQQPEYLDAAVIIKKADGEVKYTYFRWNQDMGAISF